ncbi:MAG: hypothetical protein NC331_15385 [Lachnospiraceae bacterium]|nr:hypothetical protein [Lachnospiraceae bacterium]MCM1240740.1 hypothetical protein [Lachnospiraceae bacterium]MCM1303859.1 hypothetical protein [Butyrivibrio sp.]MCM1343618.1 hypothetical protein [Muribaculaceae bacterium]MCM1410792.1 hypothetical protein [Lachnospiraceae bacterium]
MDTYQKWLQSEKEWIDVYCKKIRKQALCITTPLILVIMTILLGGLSAVGGGSTEDLLYGALGGFLFGAVICGIYLLALLPGLSAGRYTKKIEKNVRDLSFSESEKEQLAQEMLAADERHKVSYTITGPGSKGTPGRFVMTPHYAFLEGSSPYSILVRLSDIAWISRGEEQKTATTRQAKTRTVHSFTLHTIGFYRKDRNAGTELPDIAYGFFKEETREQVMELLKESGIEIR